MRTEIGRRAIAAANVSIASNSLLVTGKVIVGILGGSMAVLSEALHSLVDLLAAVMARYAVGKSQQPADDRHPHGHGKFESVSGTVEGFLVFSAAGLIWIAAGHRLSEGGEVSESLAGIVVMVVSAVVNIAVSRYLFRVAKAAGSVALEADAVHLRADVWTSIGVVGGLVAIRLTGLHVLDPLVAIVVGAVIAGEGWAISRRAIGQLLDEALPDEEQEAVRGVLSEHYETIAGFHKLRSRRAGPQRHVDVHVEMCRKLPLQEVHDTCSHLEEDIRGEYPNTDVLIHPEPCDGACERGVPLADRPAWCRATRVERQTNTGLTEDADDDQAANDVRE